MFDPKIRIGEELTEKQIHQVFECQTQLGIRLSIKNNLIVLIHKTYDNKYIDTWQDGVLLYTGTDASSDSDGQTLFGPGNNNGLLYNAWINRYKANNPTIFLFEKPAQNKCFFQGVVNVCDEPHQVPASSDSAYMVWRFPLKFVDVNSEKVKEDFALLEKEALKKGFTKLKKQVKASLKANGNSQDNITRQVTSIRYERNPLYSAYVKLRAAGECDLCGQSAPFKDKDENPYLESHHIKWLSKGGKDSPNNMVALCPNCHKRVHILNSNEDEQKLIEQVERYSFFSEG